MALWYNGLSVRLIKNFDCSKWEARFSLLNFSKEETLLRARLDYRDVVEVIINQRGTSNSLLNNKYRCNSVLEFVFMEYRVHFISKVLQPRVFRFSQLKAGCYILYKNYVSFIMFFTKNNNIKSYKSQKKII